MVISYFVCPGWRVLHGTGSTTREALSGPVGITNETSASFQHAGYQRHEASLPCPASIQAPYTDVTSSHTDEGENVLTLKEHKPSSSLFPYSTPKPPRIDSPRVLHNHTQHSDTPHSVGLLWTSDQPDAETSSWQHTSNIHDLGRIRTHDLSKRAVVDPRLRPRGHWDHFPI